MRGRHVVDVRAALVDRVDLTGIEVEPDGLVAGAAELDRQRESDVAETDDSGLRFTRLDELHERERGGSSSGSNHS